VPVIAPPAAVAASPTAPDPKGPDFVVRRVLDIPGRIAFGTWYWDEAGVPDGPIVITVDLAAQTISVFRDGYEIGTAAIIYGDDGLPTPLGIFPILEKDADHISNLYHAPMPFMLRLTNDGISIHGSLVRRNYATHGCVGVPTPFAKKLFGVAHIGDHVIITRNKRLPAGKA
jgi:lipoprotein-anchoring transpeptidase ErfK/SrfK